MFEGILFLILIGVPVLIVLVELVDAVVAFVRRRLAADDGVPEIPAGFCMRRPGSKLRTRHHHKIRITDNSEAIRYQVPRTYLS